jgi:ribonuclease HI
VKPIAQVYTDGGVCGSSRSALGGTWAVVQVDADDELVDSFAGVIRPLEYGLGDTVTNNVAEYYAMLWALSRLPDNWSGTVLCDSEITIGRFSMGWKHNGIPERWIERMRHHVRRMGRLAYVRLDGHPTAEQIRTNRGKRGNPVSKWNVMADYLCGEAKQYLEPQHA